MIEIHPLKIDDDFKDLIALSREFFMEYESHHVDFFKIDKLHDDDIIDYFSKWITHDDGETFIAVTGDVIVGYITVYVQSQAGFWKIKQVGNISGLMVHSAHRRKGIARQLLGKGKSFFKKKGVRYFTAFTAVGNRDAIRFYKKCGMTSLYTTMMGEINNR